MGKSLNAKINKSLKLAFKILDTATERMTERSWKLVDVGYDRYINILNNKCSLKDTIKFDLKELEAKIDNDIEHSLQILNS